MLPCLLYSMPCCIGHFIPLDANLTVSRCLGFRPTSIRMFSAAVFRPVSAGSLLLVHTAMGISPVCLVSSCCTESISTLNSRRNLVSSSPCSLISIMKLCNNIPTCTIFEHLASSKRRVLQKMPQRMTSSPKAHSM